METTEREGLEIIDWTEGQTDCRAGRVENQNPGGEVESNGGKDRNGGNWGRARAGSTGKGLSNHVLRARDVDNFTSKLRDVGKMALLWGGPMRRGVEQGVCQGLVVREKGKFTSFQEKAEMADGGVGS